MNQYTDWVPDVVLITLGGIELYSQRREYCLTNTKETITVYVINLDTISITFILYWSLLNPSPHLVHNCISTRYLISERQKNYVLFPHMRIGSRVVTMLNLNYYGVMAIGISIWWVLITDPREGYQLFFCFIIIP